MITKIEYEELLKIRDNPNMKTGYINKVKYVYLPDNESIYFYLEKKGLVRRSINHEIINITPMGNAEIDNYKRKRCIDIWTLITIFMTLVVSVIMLFRG